MSGPPVDTPDVAADDAGGFDADAPAVDTADVKGDVSPDDARERVGPHLPSPGSLDEDAHSDAETGDGRRRRMRRPAVKGSLQRVSKATGEKLDDATERFTPYASRRSIRYFALSLVALAVGAIVMVGATIVHTDAQQDLRRAQDQREDLLESYSPRQEELELGELSLEAYQDQAGRIRGHEERYVELLDDLLVQTVALRTALLDNEQRAYDSAAREANRLLARLGSRLDDAGEDLASLAEARTELARALREEEVPLDGQPFTPLEEDLRLAGFARSLR